MDKIKNESHELYTMIYEDVVAEFHELKQNTDMQI